MPTVGEIATRIYDNEFDDQPTQLEREFKVEGFSGWLESNVGQLNNLLYSSFSSGTNFKQEEENIFTQIYLQDYYTREARVVMKMSASTGSIDWTRLTEGDTTIVRSNRVDVSRLYRNLAKDASEKIKELVYAYNSYQAMPRQTAGFDGGFISGSGYYRYPPYIT